MIEKQAIYTNKAPAVIGPYSQAIKIDNVVYLSGQIPFNAESDQLITNNVEAETHQVFKNLTNVAEAAGGSLANIVKLTIFLTDLSHFSQVNDIMTRYFSKPYPARSTIGVAALPKGVTIEIEGILVLENNN